MPTLFRTFRGWRLSNKSLQEITMKFLTKTICIKIRHSCLRSQQKKLIKICNNGAISAELKQEAREQLAIITGIKEVDSYTINAIILTNTEIIDKCKIRFPIHVKFANKPELEEKLL